ncbi:MAG: glycoside hydrolase family 3 protein, partial [Oscillospiraceae bacterium]|nr:glycoside hydrolase family 3 protein [Oscillospiraceae bacterium]
RLQLLDGGTGINFEQLFGDFLSSSGLDGIGGNALRNVLKYFYTPEKLPDESARELYDFIVQKLHALNPELTAPGCYPPGILLGATWNPEVIYDTGTALGREARTYGVNVLLGTPNVNLHRDIRSGRLFEGYSEDPCLVSALAPSLVRGLQAEGTAANVKHFAANHQETNRMNINELIPERALHELYYPGFKACVEAGVATVMSAYNQINGTPCTENRILLHDMLREEWGFEGVVMSDWNAVYHPAAAVNAGNDLAMPGPIAPDALTAAFEDGTLSADALDTSSERIAKLAKQYAKPAKGRISIAETDKAAYRAAAEGIVLLKNEGKALPLASAAKIALYGEYAEYLLTCGEGSAGINTNRNVSFYKALSMRFGGVSLHNMEGDTDTLIYVYSLPGREGNDRREIALPRSVTEEWEALLAEADSRSMKKILVLNVSAPVALDGWEQRFDGIFCIFLPGMQGANALADCLCGKVNPSGKLPLTWPKRMEDMPAYLNFPGDGMQVHYGEGIFVGYRWYD